jgi:hypothetical protein
VDDALITMSSLLSVVRELKRGGPARRPSIFQNAPATTTCHALA